MNHFCAIVLTQMFCGMAVKKNYISSKTAAAAQTAAQQEMCVCVCVSLGKVNDFLINLQFHFLPYGDQTRCQNLLPNH